MKLAIDGGTPLRTEPFPYRKDIGAEELALVTEVINSGQLCLHGGEKVPQFEARFAQHYGVKHCTATTSGTAALHVAVGGINPNPGDEFITAPITDMGTIIAILGQNCIPVFADIDPATYNVSPASIEERITDRTVGIIPVHLFGNPCDMDAIMDIATRHDLYVIEDSSQAYGTMYAGRRCGTIGHVGAFSLQQSKHITTGDGGLTITDDNELGERIHLFGNKGWPNYSAKGAREYVQFGFCYRMTELTAAVGLAQLRKLDRITAAYNWAGDLLARKLQDIAGITPPATQPDGLHTYWLFALRIDEKVLGMTKERFAEAVTAEGAPCSAGYIGYPIFLYKALREKRIYGDTLFPFDSGEYGSGHEVPYEPGYCPEAEKALDEMVCLRVNQYFTEEDVRDMADIVRKVAESGSAT